MTSSRENLFYLRALKATEEIEEPAIGLSNKDRTNIEIQTQDKNIRTRKIFGPVFKLHFRDITQADFSNFQV